MNLSEVQLLYAKKFHKLLSSLGSSYNKFISEQALHFPN